ncbi:MAG: nuclear transport factor 2 family protein [Planctomycetes bacterium]|nr:nuclear transport factor 2 family protein [Planctomycetota bacterium]
MSVETIKELDDFFRSMRQAYNARDLKAYRSHCWTDKRFAHLDASGRIDVGWGTYEEILDQDFRYMDKVTLELKDLAFNVLSDQFATAYGIWKVVQVDPDGRTVERSGRVSFSVARMRDDWKIVHQHFSADLPE